MEEEMFSLCNIMPVELAIRRELEYRKKMDVARNQPQNDLKPLLLAQGPPTQPGKEDIELAEHVSQKSPMPQFSSSCPTLQEITERVSQKSPMPQFSSSCPTFQEQLAFSCKACQLTFATVFHLSGHIVSEQHKVNVSLMKKRKAAISNPIWCELCRSSCSSLGEMERHLSGSRHNSLVSEIENGKRALATNSKGKKR